MYLITQLYKLLSEILEFFFYFFNEDLFPFMLHHFGYIWRALPKWQSLLMY